MANNEDIIWDDEITWDEGVSQTQYTPNIFGKFYEVPRGAIRSAIQGKGYMQGAINPEQVPSMQKVILDKYYNWVDKTSQGMSPIQSKIHTGIMSIPGMGVSALGYGADIATDPGMILTTMGLGALGKAIAPTKVGQALGRFLAKERKFIRFGKNAVLDVAKKGVVGLDKLDDMAGQKYETGIQGIKGETKDFTKIKTSITEAKSWYPEEKFSQLDAIDERLTKTKSMTAPELRNLKMELKKGIPRGVFQGKTDPTPIQMAKLRVYDAVDDELVKLGGGKYIGMKAEYTDWKNTATDAYRVLLEEGRPGDVNLRNWFGYGLSRRKMLSLEKASSMLPPKEQFMQDFLAWRRGQIAKLGLGATVGLGALYGVRRKVGETVLPQEE